MPTDTLFLPNIAVVAKNNSCETALLYGVSEEYACIGPHADIADIVICGSVLDVCDSSLVDIVIADVHKRAIKIGAFMMKAGTAEQIRPEIENKFAIIEWTASGDGTLCIGKPLYQVGEINNVPCVSDEERNRQVELNCVRVKERVRDTRDKHGNYILNGRTAILVCFGPSLHGTWPEIAMAAVRDDSDVFSTSGAHKFLIDHSIVPYAHIECDPRAHKAKQIGSPHPDVRYWLASCVHPSWLDMLAGYNVALWHSYNGQESLVALKWEPGSRMISGGGSIGLRAMALLYAIGYRSFEIHGMDCSFADGTRHAGVHLNEKDDAVVSIKCGDRWFDTQSNLLLYLRYFEKQVALLPDATFHLHGDGLLQHLWKLKTEVV